MSLLLAIVGWCVTHVVMELIVRIAFWNYEDTSLIVQTLSHEGGIWSFTDLVMRMCWCGMAGARTSRTI